MFDSNFIETLVLSCSIVLLVEMTLFISEYNNDYSTLITKSKLDKITISITSIIFLDYVLLSLKSILNKVILLLNISKDLDYSATLYVYYLIVFITLLVISMSYNTILLLRNKS